MNDTVRLWLPPSGTLSVLSATLNRAASAPPLAIPVMFSVPVPLLVTTSGSVAVALICRSPNASGLATAMVGCTPRPVTVTSTEGLAESLVVSVSVASAWPSLVGANVTVTDSLVPSATVRVVADRL